jgi:uncharacterized protein YjdB
LDLGDPPKKMTVGESQMLGATVIPLDATNQDLTYSSSTPTVAEINAIGRITAKRAGIAKITVSAGAIIKSFMLEIVDEPTTVVAGDLDLGDYPKEMAIGSTTTLSVTVIPIDTENQKLTYTSSNPQAATINEIGRISALASGETIITIKCDQTARTFRLKVVPVTIEIEDFESELAVDEMLRLSARVTPDNAPVTTILYKSSDPKIATVSPAGEVKGIAPGQVTITLTAGEVKKDVLLIVNISGKRIELNSKYIILKPGENFAIQASLIPSDARQNIQFKSFDSNVATVSSTGTVMAQGFGTTTILVSTDDTGAAATVIVNQSGAEETTKPEEPTIPANTAPTFATAVSAVAYPVITKDMLKYYYENGEICTIIGDGYQITIMGKEIVNYNNELKTILEFTDEKNGTSFVLNDGNPLCGSVTVKLTNSINSGKYLYLYNEVSGKYKQLQAEKLPAMKLDVAGKYLIAQKKLSGFELKTVFAVIAGVLVLSGVATYIAVKKKHLFW